MVCIIHSSHAHWLHWTWDNWFLLRAVTELKMMCKAPWTPFTPSITESRWVRSTLHTRTDHTEHDTINFFSELSLDLKGHVRHSGPPSPLLYPCWAFWPHALTIFVALVCLQWLKVHFPTGSPTGPPFALFISSLSILGHALWQPLHLPSFASNNWRHISLLVHL